MFTQCPECLKTQHISAAQLRNDHGMVTCKVCRAFFDALPSLTETAGEELSPTTATQDLPWEQAPTKHKALWLGGFFLGLVLLTVQIIYFEGGNLSRQKNIRLFLEKVCLQWGCSLPFYNNLEDFDVLKGSFSQTQDGNYGFNAVIRNQAAFSQTYPRLKLTLLDYNGVVFAQRIFKPEDYLNQTPKPTALAAGAATEISLAIAAPATKVGGYTFELVD